MKILTFEWKLFFKELYDKFFETDVLSASAQVAFYFSFAFFPLLLFLVTLFGMVLESTDELRVELYSYLAQIMPPSIPASMITTAYQGVSISSPASAAIPAQRAPAINWPSAPMFQTLAR